ncbi:MAG: pilus assembly protein HicB [Bacteroidaceae bacterium]|nr:pilus assembly protein HicB [Bacteroidaceae bacterium]
MTKKVTVIIEKASDGTYSCYTKESFKGYALFGYGETAEETKKDFLAGYEEMKELLKSKGKKVGDYDFIWKYDMASFFDYFKMLNITEVAKKANVNPSLLRRYSSGRYKAPQGIYDRVHTCVGQIAKELSSATF